MIERVKELLPPPSDQNQKWCHCHRQQHEGKPVKRRARRPRPLGSITGMEVSDSRQPETPLHGLPRASARPLKPGLSLT
jgi:hypothetical protein